MTRGQHVGLCQYYSCLLDLFCKMQLCNKSQNEGDVDFVKDKIQYYVVRRLQDTKRNA